MNFHGDDIVKSCRRLESGLRFGPDGIRACTLGAYSSPFYWSVDEASGLTITKEMIIEKRKWLLDQLNDEASDITCKRCLMVTEKRYGDINLTHLGQIDLASTSRCNLNCSFCGFVKGHTSRGTLCNDLQVLREFKVDDIEWDAVVDFNGGEPTLLDNLEEYFEYFASRRIRIRFMTNGVKFSQPIYDGLANGNIQWVCTSVDAGTPTTYLRIKKKDCYLQVLENLTRYAHAGNLGGGMLAIKYIFCNENCSDDDIAGFTYAMLAIRPNQVYLTFDFSVMGGDAVEIGDYDYSRDIAAYAKMYNLLRKHGLTPVHYSLGHMALVTQKGRDLLAVTQQQIAQTWNGGGHPTLELRNFRQPESNTNMDADIFNIRPLRIQHLNGQPQPWSLAGKRVLITPACAKTIDLLNTPDIAQSQVLGFLDRDKVVQGKSIDGLTIYGYDDIPRLKPDVILMAAPEQHCSDILHQLTPFKADIPQVAILGPSCG